MSKHIFLTGSKQIGKSTIIQNYLSAHPVKCAGFLTVKSETVFPESKSVHMLDASLLYSKAIHEDACAGTACTFGPVVPKKEKPSKENFLFFCGPTPDTRYRQYELLPDPAPRFTQIGCNILDSIPEDTDLIIMDEIGPHESESVAFCNSIFQHLNGTIPVLGVLQQTDTALFRKIANHPNAELIVITKENRDWIAERIGLRSGI